MSPWQDSRTGDLSTASDLLKDCSRLPLYLSVLLDPVGHQLETGWLVRDMQAA